METKNQESQFEPYLSKRLIYLIIFIQLVIFSSLVTFLYENIKDNLVLFIPINILGCVALFFSNKESAKNERFEAKFTRKNSPVKAIFSFIAEIIWVIITWGISYWGVLSKSL